MQPADRVAFVKILNGLASIKPGGKLSPEAIDMWWLSMTAWSLDEFRSAAAHLATAVEFMPNPYHFEQLRKAGRITPGEAWALVLDCARKGRHLPDDPVIESAVRAIGGLQAVAMSPMDKTHFLERAFNEHFERIQDAHDTREAVPQIACEQPLKRLTGPQPVQKLLARSAR